jgi:hypothetical protein
MLYLEPILRYLPFLGILIAAMWYYRFYSDTLPQVGKGSDAAGAGMAKGFAVMTFYAGFGLYLSILLAALVLFFIGTQVPRLQALLNLSLLLPLFWFGSLDSTSASIRRVSTRRRPDPMSDGTRWRRHRRSPIAKIDFAFALLPLPRERSILRTLRR